MRFGLIIIGDEIIHGTRSDAHFPYFRQLLTERGLQLESVRYLPDERDLLIRELRDSFERALPTFITGGIGGTPDDHTRQAAAAALGRDLQLHREAAANIEALSLKRGDALDSPAHHARLNMAEFPIGADLIPNPYNNIAGFSVQQHYFLPGFPIMAHPMAQWVLDTHYADVQHRIARAECAIRLFKLPESAITAMMEDIERQNQNIRTFSLPTVSQQHDPAYILFGLKAEGDEACAALPAVWAQTLAQLQAMGGVLQEAETD